MSQIIQHRRGSLANIKTLNSTGPIHRGEILVATGSLYISSGSGDSDNYHLSASIFFGGSLTPGGSDYVAITKVLSGSGLPSMTTNDYGTSLNGILWINTDDNKLYSLSATEDGNPSTSGNFTGSHVEISGGGSSGGTIGPAEDGSYADGLFTDFTQNTLIGTPIDRFNEVLKALAPSPAPDLDDIESTETDGVAGDLSFGASNTISGVSNVTAVGALGAIDVNGAFVESGDRRGIIRRGLSGSFAGTLNNDEGAGPGSPNTAYPAKAFGDANIGVLEMFVNGNKVCSASLSGSNSSFTATGGGGSSITVSATSSAKFPDGTELDVFINRTGTFSVHLTDQRPGHNFVQIKHVKPTSETTTNFVDFVIDDFAGSSAIDINETGSWSFTSPGTLKTVSGIKYYDNGFEDNTAIPYTASFTNLYRDTYPSSGGITIGTQTRIASSALSITGDGITTSNQSGGSGVTSTFNFASLNTSVSNCHETATTMSAAITPGISSNTFHQPSTFSNPSGSATSDIRFRLTADPLHRSAINGTQYTETRFLYNSLTPGAYEHNFEDFKGETYRQTYNATTFGTSTGGFVTSNNLATETDNGVKYAVQYNTYLVYPTKAGNSGDFTTAKGPSSQHDYTSASGERSYIRYFKARVADGGNSEFALEFIGNARLVTNTSTLFATGTNYIRVQVMRIDDSNSNFHQAWTDPLTTGRIGSGFTSPNSMYIPISTTTSYVENNNVGGSNFATGVAKFQDLGAGLPSGASWGVRIIMPEGFTGNIDAIGLHYGSATDTSGQTRVLGNTYTNF